MSTKKPMRVEACVLRHMGFYVWQRGIGTIRQLTQPKWADE